METDNKLQRKKAKSHYYKTQVQAEIKEYYDSQKLKYDYH